MEISKGYNCSPFEILNADTNYVILCINYFMEKVEREDAIPIQSKGVSSVYYEKDGTKVTRKRVNNATANWW